MLRDVAVVFLVPMLLASCTTHAPAPDRDARAALAPTGKLRVGVYVGSPTSYVAPEGGDARGIGYDVGRVMAERLGVAFEPAIFPSNAQLYEAFRAGRIDVLLTNATEERRRFIDFSAPVLFIEKSYLVPAGSAVSDARSLDRDGMRVGVSQGSTTSTELGRVLEHATFIPAPSLKDAGRMLAEGRIDAYASNNAILHEMGDGLPGSRVLPGRWGTESFALGIPKGRDAGHAWLDAFARQARADGTVGRAATRAGVRGTIESVETK